MKKTELCPGCNNFTTYASGSSFQNLFVRTEYVKMRLNYNICDACDHRYSTREQFEKARLEAHRIYKKKHNLFMSEDLIAFKEALNLNNNEFANLFNWGTATIYRYQKGYLQTRAHNRIFQIMKNPHVLKRVLSEYHVHLPDEKKRHILKWCNQRIRDQNGNS